MVLQGLEDKQYRSRIQWIDIARCGFLRTAFFLLLIIVTIISIVNPVPLQSAELTTRTTVTPTQSRTDYMDSSGRVAFASDKGYATVLKTIEDGRVLIERYYDERENLVILPAGYAQVERKYENGLNTLIIYEDAEGHPVVIKNGYDSIHRSYDSLRRAETDTYWIGEVQVKRKQGYWQYLRVYEGEKISEIRYLDSNGNLVKNTSGYALIRRSYDGGATIDLYYDAGFNPVPSTIGQYGKKVETVGDSQITTYLGADREPANTTKGYATIEKAGAKTLYYDADGNPVTIGKNQFGIEKINGQSVYLDEDGNVMYRLDNILNTHPWIVLVGGITLTALAVILRGRARVSFLACAILFILYMTMFYRKAEESRGVFEMFASYSSFFISAMTRQNILNNIWLFVPLGAVLYCQGHPYRWLWAVGLSVVIETAQYFTGIGLCEIDDVLSNGLGALIGYGVSHGYSLMTNKRKTDKL